MNNTTLLVVEDEPNLLSDISEILQSEGYNIIQANNGREALEKLIQHSKQLPDLIISDIMMPFMNGTELLQEVRKNKYFCTIPFIFLSAKNTQDDINYGKMLGAEDYITKPFNSDDLLVAVKAKLNRHEQLSKIYDNNVNKIKKEILTILSHEFRTPLTSIVGYSAILKEYNIDELSTEELNMFLGEVHKGADRLHHLIQNFIILIEIYSGGSGTHYSFPTIGIDDWQYIIDHAIEQVASLNRVNACFTINMPPTLPLIKGNPELITKMVREYLHNAAKFSPSNATVELTVEAMNDSVRISVMDEGRGIPAHEHWNIWELLYQINREKYEDQGAGCGLTIVKELADLHYAAVGLESEFGQGSHFWIDFPISNTV